MPRLLSVYPLGGDKRELTQREGDTVMGEQKNTGRASTSLSIPTRSANITPATRCRRGRSSTACSATARFICWGGSAGETSPIWKAASRTAASAWYPTAGRTMDLLPTVSRRLLARWRNGRRRKDSKRRFQPIHSEMHMKKAPNCYAQAGAFLDIGSRSFNKVAGRHPVSEGCCPPYC